MGSEAGHLVGHGRGRLGRAAGPVARGLIVANRKEKECVRRLEGEHGEGSWY